MNPKTSKKAIRMLLSFIIAFAMVGIPAGVFTTTTATDIELAPAHSFDASEEDTGPIPGADPYGTVELVNESFEDDWGDFTPSAGWTRSDAKANTGTYSACHGTADDGDNTLCVTVDATGLRDTYLTYYIYEPDANYLHWNILVDGNVVHDEVTTGVNRGSWILYQLDLSAYDGTSFDLCIEYDDFGPYGSDNDMYVDDVLVTASDRPDGIDIVFEGFQNLTCGERYNTQPRYIEAIVVNYGDEVPQEPVSFHFQIYEEKPFDLTDLVCYNNEECHLNTWEVIDGNGDGVTWYWTEKRSFSPNHSFHTQPDYLSTYEAYSEDYLQFQEYHEIPANVNSYSIGGAFLNFSYWVEGEFGGIPYDYGVVYIQTETSPTWVPIGGPYYDSSGEWEYEQIDISAYIGEKIKIRFGWFADGYMNYEGMYVDDVCIKVQYGALQRLIWSDYQYVDFSGDQGPGVEHLVRSQLPWDTIKNDTNYWIEFYLADNYIDDVNMENNYVNCSVWFGDVCDAAITDIDAPEEVEFQHQDGYVTIPIDVTVYNNGTTPQEVPVKLLAQHKITEVIVHDDVESGDLGWGNMWVVGDNTNDIYWKITGDDFYSPLNSWGITEGPAKATMQGKVWQPIDPFVQGGLRWDAKLKWSGDYAYGQGLQPVWRASKYYWDLSLDVGRAPPYYGSSPGWYNFDVNELIATEDLYWEGIAEYDALLDAGWPQNLNTLLTALNQRYGPEGLGIEDFSELEFGFIIKDNDGVAGDEAAYWDDFKLYHQYPGEVVWEDTLTTGELAPGETEVLNFEWNTTEYCDYFLTAVVMLDCDMDPKNNDMTTETRIYEQMYDDVEDYTTDDNTAGQPDHWHIVEECSFCPEDHFWWCGDDETGMYGRGWNEVLQIDETFNWTGATEIYLNFSAWLSLEWSTVNNLFFPGPYDYAWDVVIIEISNNSGLDWYPLDVLWKEYDWTDYSYDLVLWALMNGWDINTFFTDQMHVRFRFQSDTLTNWKGAYIDDVSIDVDGETMFFDDMENGEDKWFHEQVRSYVLWHNETVFGAAHAPSAEWFWNGDDTGSPYNGDAWLTWFYYVYFNGGIVHTPGDTFDDWSWILVMYAYDASFNEYRNNMDEKLIFEFDLMQAYEAFLTFEQNYSFADDKDLGWLEIWTGSEWKPLLRMKGSAVWAEVKYDITQYIDYDEATKIRFRFESNATQVDYGWLIDMVSIEGKVDYTAPTATHTISPATPNGKNGWYTSDVTITLTAEDNVKVGAIKYRIDGGSWLTYTAPLTIGIEGEHTVEYYPVDTVGNEGATGSVSFKIDKTNPTASITVPQAGYIYFFGRELMPRLIFKDKALIIGGLVAQATASDAMSGLYVVKFNEDGTTFAEDTTSPYQAPLPFSLFAAHELTVTAEDMAGNTYTTSAVPYFKIF